MHTFWILSSYRVGLEKAAPITFFLSFVTLSIPGKYLRPFSLLSLRLCVTSKLLVPLLALTSFSEYSAYGAVITAAVQLANSRKGENNAAQDPKSGWR